MNNQIKDLENAVYISGIDGKGIRVYLHCEIDPNGDLSTGFQLSDLKVGALMIHQDLAKDTISRLHQMGLRCSKSHPLFEAIPVLTEYK